MPKRKRGKGLGLPYYYQLPMSVVFISGVRTRHSMGMHIPVTILYCSLLYVSCIGVACHQPRPLKNIKSHSHHVCYIIPEENKDLTQSRGRYYVGCKVSQNVVLCSHLCLSVRVGLQYLLLIRFAWPSPRLLIISAELVSPMHPCPILPQCSQRDRSQQPPWHWAVKVPEQGTDAPLKGDN